MAGPLNILLVEDDPVEAEAVRRALARHQVPGTLHHVRDGGAALERLRGTPGQPALPQPCVILLDLNMPGMNGLEFLDELRADPNAARNIVFVVTTSDQDKDKRAAYRRHVAGYVVKSNIGTAMTPLMELLKDFQRTVEFPPA